MNAYVAFTAAHKQLERYQTSIHPDSDEILKQIEEALEKGETNIDDVMDTQSSNIDVSMEHLKASQDFQDTISGLEEAVGKSLDDK
jgi:outer membrane protein TolC